MTENNPVRPGVASVYVSALDLFSIGIGPSSSHTVGPMRAAKDFRDRLELAGSLADVCRWQCQLFGSLASTGLGHGTPDAVIAGLRGFMPETVDPSRVHGEWAQCSAGETVFIDGIRFAKHDIQFSHRVVRESHPNVLVFTAELRDGRKVAEKYASIGGGFIEHFDAQDGSSEPDASPGARPDVSPKDRVGKAAGQCLVATQAGPQFRTMAELLELAQGRSIAEVAWEAELAIHGEARAREGLDRIWTAMRDSVERGLLAEGVLPGVLGVKRRAAAAWRMAQGASAEDAEERALVYALAVNEENASGGRVVTAPTNGAAGVLPATLYYETRRTDASAQDVRDFLLTATAIGSLIKANASISGAEAGCQAEVGSACAMAAAGLTAMRGGSPMQVENAAEIAIEHHLGLTCDPVSGLVQIPCIERNAIASSTAFTACRLALLGDGRHVVGLDTAIETMRQTGKDMSMKYKETSAAGLAVNVVEC